MAELADAGNVEERIRDVKSVTPFTNGVTVSVTVRLYHFGLSTMRYLLNAALLAQPDFAQFFIDPVVERWVQMNETAGRPGFGKSDATSLQWR